MRENSRRPGGFRMHILSGFRGGEDHVSPGQCCRVVTSRHAVVFAIESRSMHIGDATQLRAEHLKLVGFVKVDSLPRSKRHGIR